MSRLAETQRLLAQLITAPEGVGAALAADTDRGGPLASALARTIRGEAGLDVVQRLDVYANMYFFRILDVLKEGYPATHALLGEVQFHNLVTDYLLRHPPAHFSIRQSGRHLSEFLTGHAAAVVHPCVADLARLERALSDAFEAADVPALGAATLAAAPPEQWPGLQLALHPSVHLLNCQWPVQKLRAAADGGAPVEDPAAEAVHICVWRRDLTVFHRALPDSEFAALEALARGASFGDVCAAASAEMAADQAAPQVAAALARWLADGWLAAPRVA